MKKYIYASLFSIVIILTFHNSFSYLTENFFTLFNPSIKNTAKLELNRESNLKNRENLKREVLKKIVKSLKSNNLNYSKLKTDFQKNSFATALALYRPGNKRILVVRKNKDIKKRLISLIEALKNHPRFDSVFKSGKLGYYLQIDLIEEPKEIDFFDISQVSLDSKRFEIGVDGLRVTCEDKKNYYLLPSDALFRSLHSINQLKRYVKRLVAKNNYLNCKYRKFNSNSYLYNDKKVLNLYRGIPEIRSVNLVDIEQVALNSALYVAKNQKEDGRFLYYYDVKSDTEIDHQHPKRDPKKNPYYNMLRHNGGGLLMLHEYERTNNKLFLESANKSAKFLVKNLNFYKPDYANLLYNKKSKLGGSGTALYFLVMYQKITKTNEFKKEILALKNHLLKQVLDTGEFIYYDIYLDKPITSKENKSFFNFYYPGEALCGLIAYYNYLADSKDKPYIAKKIKKALNFLVIERPKLYPEYFKSLPSDSWLMMAINHLWDSKELRDPKYANFVFSDVKQMLKHMYKEEDALYPDYSGSFYYNYGDHPYPDGARAEGVIAALSLALKIKNKKLVNEIVSSMKLINKALYRLVNTPDLLYLSKNPQRALWSIRFKLTRQWIRVDTIQHVAAYYSKQLFLNRKYNFIN